MQIFLEKFKKIQDSEDDYQKAVFKAEIQAAIEAYAEVTDYLKKQHFIWNRKTNELCTIRDMIKNPKGELHES